MITYKNVKKTNNCSYKWRNKINRKIYTIISLLKNLNLNKNNIAIEVNREIVNKSNYTNHIIMDKDKIEIVNFIGGGSNISDNKDLLKLRANHIILD